METSAVTEGRLQRGGASERRDVVVGVRLVVVAQRGTPGLHTTLEGVVGVGVRVVGAVGGVVGTQVAARP